MQELPKESLRYGMIQVHRTNSTGTHLVGSDIEHQQFITLKISKAIYERNLKNDWWFDRDNIIEVSMTLSQWAEFISSPNTSGVPCTIDQIQGRCLWKEEEVPFVDKIKLHDDEYKRHWTENIKELKNLVWNLSQSFENKESRKTQRELIHELELLINNFIPNERFAINEFEEHIERRVNQAKTEISNYLARFLQNNSEQISVTLTQNLLGIAEKGEENDRLREHQGEDQGTKEIG